MSKELRNAVIVVGVVLFISLASFIGYRAMVGQRNTGPIPVEPKPPGMPEVSAPIPDTLTGSSLKASPSPAVETTKSSPVITRPGKKACSAECRAYQKAYANARFANQLLGEQRYRTQP